MNQTTKVVRFGIIADGMEFPAWQAQVIRHLCAHPQVEAALIIRDGRKGAGDTSPGLHAQKSRASRSLLWKWRHHYYVRKKAKAYRPEALADLLGELPEVPYRHPQEVEAIRAYQLDFILDFGSGPPLQGAILNAARFGVWSYQHDPQRAVPDAAIGFWEIYRAELVTTAVLQRLTADPNAPVILKSGAFKTQLRQAKNLDQALLGSTRWPTELCVDILNGQRNRLDAPPTPGAAARYSSPGNWELLLYFARASRLQIRKAVRSLLYTDYWNIGIAPAPVQAFLQPETLPPVQWFPHLAGKKFIADPFAHVAGDKIYIIYEDFLFREGLGTIGTLEFDKNGFSGETIRIKEPFHLSYPFTFEYRNAVYAIPESYQAGQVRLYKAIDFPHSWTLERVLIDDYQGIDNTLFQDGDYWYLFSTDKRDGVHHNLQIHYAEDLFGRWRPHPKNPVKTDIRSARPAGPLFRHHGDVYRPSMDYSEKVEGRIIINKIKVLSPTDFDEEVHNVINPFPDTFYSDKVHTICAAGAYTVVDGARELLVLGNIHALKYKLRTLTAKLQKRLRLTT